MDSLRTLWQRLRSSPAHVRAGVAVGVALLAGLTLALATSGGDSALDEGEAAATAATETAPVEREPRLVEPVESEQPARRESIDQVERPLEETEARVRRVFRVVSRGSREGLNKAKLKSVRCARGACEVRYTADGPGAGRLIESQGPIWRELFSNPRVEEATVVALPGGPDYEAGASGGLRPVKVSCDRTALDTVRDIGEQAAPFVQRECEVTATDAPGQ